ncbi:MAG: hypothetical protein LBB45_04375 [Methanobrevibacter sp.]|jgi:hypothetical protein|nr:hypothetical protein [Candidatus Methanovirga basalitermitum]
MIQVFFIYLKALKTYIKKSKNLRQFFFKVLLFRYGIIKELDCNIFNYRFKLNQNDNPYLLHPLLSFNYELIKSSEKKQQNFKSLLSQRNEKIITFKREVRLLNKEICLLIENFVEEQFFY